MVATAEMFIADLLYKICIETTFIHSHEALHED